MIEKSGSSEVSKLKPVFRKNEEKVDKVGSGSSSCKLGVSLGFVV